MKCFLDSHPSSHRVPSLTAKNIIIIIFLLVEWCKLAFRVYIFKFSPLSSLRYQSWEDVNPHHLYLNQGPSAYQADVLTSALWYSSHQHRRKHNIFPTCLHFLATHTNTFTCLVLLYQKSPHSLSL